MAYLASCQPVLNDMQLTDFAGFAPAATLIQMPREDCVSGVPEFFFADPIWCIYETIGRSHFFSVVCIPGTSARSRLHFRQFARVCLPGVVFGPWGGGPHFAWPFVHQKWCCLLAPPLQAKGLPFLFPLSDHSRVALSILFLPR